MGYGERNFIDELKDKFYWYDPKQQVEVMALEYDDSSLSEELYSNYADCILVDMSDDVKMEYSDR